MTITVATQQENVTQALNEYRRLSDEAIRNDRAFLKSSKNEVNFSNWLTVKRYAERYNLTEQIITDWISVGKISADCTMMLPEINNIRLVKNQPY